MSDKSQTTIRTYQVPARGRCWWKAAFLVGAASFDPGKPIRPYSYVGSGATEQDAIDHLKALEAADTWSATKDTSVCTVIPT